MGRAGESHPIAPHRVKESTSGGCDDIQVVLRQSDLISRLLGRLQVFPNLVFFQPGCASWYARCIPVLCHSALGEPSVVFLLGAGG